MAEQFRYIHILVVFWQHLVVVIQSGLSSSGDNFNPGSSQYSQVETNSRSAIVLIIYANPWRMDWLNTEEAVFDFFCIPVEVFYQHCPPIYILPFPFFALPIPIVVRTLGYHLGYKHGQKMWPSSHQCCYIQLYSWFCL